MYKYVIFLLVLVSSLLYWKGANAVPKIGSISVSTSTISLNLIPGKVSSGSIILANSGETPLVFAPHIEDCTVELGVPKCRASQSPDSAARWFRLSGSGNINIPPKGKYTLNYSINPPADVEPLRQFVTIFFDEPNSTRDGVNKTAFALNLPGTPIVRVDTRELHLIGGHEQFSSHIVLKNTGNIRVIPAGMIEVSASGVVLLSEALNPENKTLLPGTEGSFDTTKSLSHIFSGDIQVTPSLWERTREEQKEEVLNATLTISYMNTVSQRLVSERHTQDIKITRTLYRKEANTQLIAILAMAMFGFVLLLLTARRPRRQQKKKSPLKSPTIEDEIYALEEARVNLALKSANKNTHTKSTPPKSKPTIKKKSPTR